MRLDSVDLEDGELWQIMSPDEFDGATLTPEETMLSKNLPISVKYDYADMGQTEYNFMQEFTTADTQAYFTKMKMISSNTISQLVEKARELHFYLSDVRGNLYKAMKAAYPDAARNNPIVYHFELYTSQERADRSSGIRSPRVYFMLGTYGFIYILFFDPYHELNP